MASLAEYQNNKRIAKNSLLLYFRLFITMGISLYTSRIVLNVLGVEDYGIYNVVGGFVSMFSILSGTLTIASQRFLSFELGKKKPDVQKLFSTTVSIHVLLTIAIFLLLEIFGLWLFNYKINIPSDRIHSANLVFHCSVITFCINTISVPYNAAIVAYEKMSAFAYVSVFEAALKLIAVFVLFKIEYDSLVMYSIFIMIIALILRFIYGWYCHSHFHECRYKFIFDKSVFYSLFGFCGWNLIGSSASILNTQGINMLLNIFFGVAINAAKGIASQVEAAINSFVSYFMMALNPQIAKSFASENYDYMNKLILVGSKIAFFLFWIVCLPILVNTEFILKLWLDSVPLHTVSFVRLGIIFALCQNLSQCLYSAMLATGNIKKYQIIVGGLSIMAFPLAWVFFKLGFDCQWGYGAMIIFSVVCLIARLNLLQKMVPLFHYKRYLKKVICPIFYTIVPIICVVYAVHSCVKCVDLFFFFIESCFYVFFSLIMIFFFGLSFDERNYFISVVKKRLGTYVEKK